VPAQRIRVSHHKRITLKRERQPHRATDSPPFPLGSAP
jgi:hypothetical protein